MPKKRFCKNYASKTGVLSYIFFAKDKKYYKFVPEKFS